MLLFVSDLHLSPMDPATYASFRRFLAGPARAARAIYLLGDVFEVWVGDDQLQEPFYADVAKALTALADQGVALYFIAGNRDFLCGPKLAAACRWTVLPEPQRVHTPIGPVLVMHGDTLCSDDTNYQRFRRIVRHPMTQWLWRCLPYRWRSRRALRLRQQSSAMNRKKDVMLMDVNRDTVNMVMREYDVSKLIHGHTHRPAHHREEAGERWVLSDWHGGYGGYLALDDSGLHVCDWHPPAL
ncbi:UDP-2,3-diacylglucosamine diphosphatase [Chitinibacteraceae bacterium HSL-7]